MPPRPDLKSGLDREGAVLAARDRSVPLADLAGGNPLSVPPKELEGANILIRTSGQLHAALALVALDGFARRLVIAPPDLKQEYLAEATARAKIDVLVTDMEPVAGPAAGLEAVRVSSALQAGTAARGTVESEWVLFTSGTTGLPKMAAHSLAALTGAIAPRQANEKADGEKIVWGTFYDIRRYGGLQILLRALIGGASLILSEGGEAVGDFLVRLADRGVTHLTGTPSHWRRALMSPMIGRIAPRYVRLSGETADQAVLDGLKAQFPYAAMGHAYASTEAGVGFEVTDGLEGFPADFIGREGPVEMRVVEGVLQIRSPRAAQFYIGGEDSRENEGWVDTGDMVERRGERYYFAGRRDGVINVGGLKINPEEVEAVINRHPGVALSRVSGRRNPITGAIIVADVVLDAGAGDASMRDALVAFCRANLPAFKVPALIRFVEKLELTPAGKLARHG
jgi:acyl-coenzyme A synthetase/AMP-(fatty) acid ligase